MREIKFRVWDIEAKKFLSEHAAFYFDCTGVILGFRGSRFIQRLEELPGFYEVTQFTGLYDCDGRRIWEGDVLECISAYGCFKSVVIWDERLAMYRMEAYQDDGSSCELTLTSGTVKYKIIGNRFESPELLEGKV